MFEVFGLFFFFAIAFALATFVFWIWALIDCIAREPSEGNDKLIWVLVIVFLHSIGALIYCIARRPERIRRYGS